MTTMSNKAENMCESLMKVNAELMLSKKRYEIALSNMSDVVFDYVVGTKQIINSPNKGISYCLPDIIEGGVETIIAAGNIHPKSVDRFRRLYQRIHDGEAYSKEVIVTIDKDGNDIVNEFALTAIFDDDGKPIRAIGIMSDVTKTLHLQREKAYGNTLLHNSRMSYEANVTMDKVLQYDKALFEELGIAVTGSMTKMLEYISCNLIAPQHKQLFFNNSSSKNIVLVFEQGQNLITFEYLAKVDSVNYEWFEKTIHIVKDGVIGDINVRCYIKNINAKKEKAARAIEEQHFYEGMVSKSDIVYEINLTQNIFVTGHENWDALFDIRDTSSYVQMTQSFNEKALHPDDRKAFNASFARDNVLCAYAQGKTELICEYRRLNGEGRFVWIKCIMHLFDDVETGDVVAFAYVQNIDAEKKKQLELIYKSQHDLLTGFYNKITLEEKINSFLDTSDAKFGNHAFFILDLDHFKEINDNFGHAFGDVFLSQTASKIKSLFRDDDLLGRIGGDEFVIFMMHVQGDKNVAFKAAELCESLAETYTRNDHPHKVSVSIGIAIYNLHGKSYDELYRRSDAALYHSKKNGRSRFSIYSNSMQMGTTNIKEIESSKIGKTKIFEENINEYVFRILYEAIDKEATINTVLELIGKHYGVSRVYVFENSSDGTHTRNTFEWCKKGVAPQMAGLQAISYSPLGDYENNFNEDDYFFMPDIKNASPALQKILAPQGVQSLLQFSIEKNGQFVGFIGFDQCDRLMTPSQNQLSDCRNMANVLGIFITEMRAIAESNASKQLVLSIVNGLDSYAYVCDPDTHKVLFINEKTLKIAPNAKVGDACYKSFWASDVPCEGCPMKALKCGSSSNYTAEMYNHNLKIWIKVTTTWIDWLGGKSACLIDSVDITKYIAKKPCDDAT